MTDTLPSGATEKARRIDASLTYESNPQKRDELIATALLSAYQQGKQDGQREMKERAARLKRALTRAEDGAGTLPAKESVKLVPAHWHALQDAIRRLDEVQNDA